MTQPEEAPVRKPYELSKVKLRALTEQIERLLKPPVLSDEERAALHASDLDPNDRSKDDWWKRYAQLVGYNRRREFKTWATDFVEVDEAPLYDVLTDKPVSVVFASGHRAKVHPASVDRIELVEDLYFWMFKVSSFRDAIKKAPNEFESPDELLARFRKEASITRQWLYFQVCAEGAAIAEKPEHGPPKWTSEISVHEETLLLHAWLEVNVKRLQKAEQVIQLKYPLSKTATESEGKTPRGSMQGFPFMMIGVAWREKVPPKHVMANISLASIIVEYAAKDREREYHKEQADIRETARKNVASAAGIPGVGG